MVAPAAILAAAAAALWTPLRSFMPRTRHPSMAAPLVRQPSMTAATASPDTSTAPRHFSEEEWSWSKQWYPMAFCKVTDKASPHRLELLGEELVLWYDGPAQAWRTMRDACPHRRAPLSEGRIDADGQIECPYHGWTFQGVNGACTKIPQAEGGGDAPMLARCGGSAHPTVEKQGIVWVWGEPLSPGAPQPLTSLVPTCEAMDDDRFVWIDVSRDMPYSADMLLENVLDSSHVPFTHDSTISKRQNAIPLKLKLASPIAPAGFRGQQAAPPVFTGRATERTTSFRAPAYMHHRIRSSGGLEPGAPPTEEDFKAGFETWTVAYATPTGPGRCRLMARFPFRFPEPVPKPGLLGRLTPRLNAPKLAFKLLPDWVNHMGQLKVLDDDNIFLPLQERRVAADGGWRASYVTPTPADTYVNAYRRWFDAAGPPPYAAHAVDALRGKPLDKAQLLDRYTQHTAHCTSCSGALANACKASAVAKALLIAAAAALPSLLLSSAWPAAAALAVGAASVAALQRAAWSVERRLTSGLSEYPPPRNSGKASRELRTVEQGRSS